MCGGLGQATTELPGPRRVEHPVPKVASPIQSTPLSSIWRLNPLLPEIVSELLSHPLASSWLPTFLLLSNLISVLWNLRSSSSLQFLARISVFRSLHLYSPTGLYFSTFVLCSVGLILTFNEKHTEK